MGFPPLVPAVQTRQFYKPGQPPGVYGALFRVASPPPPPVVQTSNCLTMTSPANMEIDEIDGAPTGLVYVVCSPHDGSSYGEDLAHEPHPN